MGKAHAVQSGMADYRDLPAGNLVQQWVEGNTLHQALIITPATLLHGRSPVRTADPTDSRPKGPRADHRPRRWLMGRDFDQDLAPGG